VRLLILRLRRLGLVLVGFGIAFTTGCPYCLHLSSIQAWNWHRVVLICSPRPLSPSDGAGTNRTMCNKTYISCNPVHSVDRIFKCWYTVLSFCFCFSGFIGPLYSAIALRVGRYLNDTKIPMITPSATIPKLSDKTMYSTVFRTATSDLTQSKVRIFF